MDAYRSRDDKLEDLAEKAEFLSSERKMVQSERKKLRQVQAAKPIQLQAQAMTYEAKQKTQDSVVMKAGLFA